MNHKKGYVALLLMISMLSLTTVSAFGSVEQELLTTNHSKDGQHQKEENVYINLKSDGSVKNIYVVNAYLLDKKATIQDFGDYTFTKNITSNASITNKNGKITVEADSGKFFYQGNMAAKEIPWNISISYYLDNKEVKPEQLAGSSGDLKIIMQIKKNPKVDEVFFKNFLMQATVTLDTAICKNIQAEGANIVNVGDNKQLVYNIMPDTEKEFQINMQVQDFEMEPIVLNGIPAGFDIDRKSLDTSSMDEKINELTDGVSELDSGAGELKDGVIKLFDGVNELNDGADSLDDGVNELSDGVVELADGAKELDEGADELKNGAWELLSGVNELKKGSGELHRGLKEITEKNDTLRGGAEAVKSGTDQILGSLGGVSGSGEFIKGPDIQSSVENIILQALQTGGVSDNRANQIAGQMAPSAANGLASGINSSLNSQLSGLSSLKDGLVQLQNGAETLKNGVYSYTDAVETVRQGVVKLEDGCNEAATGAGELYDGTIDLKDGTIKLLDGTAELEDGVQELKDGTNDLKSGAVELSDGTKDLKKGSDELKDGTKEFDEKTSDLNSQVEGEIDQMLGKFSGSDYEPVSFVSPKNQYVSAVQFTMMTEKIVLPDEVIVQQQPVKLTIWEKFLNLFRKN